MTRRRAMLAAAGALALALSACTLVRDLDYLTDGRGADGLDGGALDGALPGDAQADGGGARTAETMVGQLVVPRLLVQDETSLYWVVADGSLLALAKEGETTARTLANVGPSVVSLAADPGSGGAIYLASNAEIRRVPKAGGAPETVATTSPRPAALAVDDANVFVMAYDPDALEVGIVRVAKGGGAPVQIAGAGPDTTDLYAIALDRDAVFWDEGDNVFRSAPKSSGPDAGATMTYRANGDDVESAVGPLAFAVDDAAIYYADGFAVRSLVRAPSATPTTLISTTDDLAEIEVIALDGEHVYALDVRAGGALWRNVKTGLGTPEKLVADLPKPNALAVDARFVYVTVEGPEGRLVRITK